MHASQVVPYKHHSLPSIVAQRREPQMACAEDPRSSPEDRTGDSAIKDDDDDDDESSEWIL